MGLLAFFPLPRLEVNELQRSLQSCRPCAHQHPWCPTCHPRIDKIYFNELRLSTHMRAQKCTTCSPAPVRDAGTSSASAAASYVLAASKSASVAASAAASAGQGAAAGVVPSRLLKPQQTPGNPGSVSSR